MGLPVWTASLDWVEASRSQARRGPRNDFLWVPSKVHAEMPGQRASEELPTKALPLLLASQKCGHFGLWERYLFGATRDFSQIGSHKVICFSVVTWLRCSSSAFPSSLLRCSPCVLQEQWLVPLVREVHLGSNWCHPGLVDLFFVSHLFPSVQPSMQAPGPPPIYLSDRCDPTTQTQIKRDPGTLAPIAPRLPG